MNIGGLKFTEEDILIIFLIFMICSEENFDMLLVIALGFILLSGWQQDLLPIT